MRALLPVSLIVCVLFGARALTRNAPQQKREWSPAKSLATIQDPRLNESSGIATSRLADGVYYTHNDSGDTARFFKFNRKGAILGVYNVTNAKAIDWEDMASAKIGGKSYLFFGDIGDNAEKRPEIVVYRVPEPLSKAGDVKADRTYRLTYPDGPHNAEALMVEPLSGDLYIVTKTSKTPSKIFRLRKPGATGAYRLEPLGEIQVGEGLSFGKLVTAGDISPDGKHVVLRTYLGIYEYDAPAKFTDWAKQPPRQIKPNAEIQGEAICYSSDGKSLLTTSEGSPCPVSAARLR